MMAVLSAEPDLDLTWLRCTPGFQSPVTVSLTAVHEREFITYQEEAAPLEWPVDRPHVGATHVSVERDLPDWVARLREQGTVVYGGVGWDSSGRWSGEVLSRLDQIDVFCPTTSKPCAIPDRRCVRPPRARSRQSWRSSPGARTGPSLTSDPPSPDRGSALGEGDGHRPTGPAMCSSPPSWRAERWTGRSRSGCGWPYSRRPCPSALSGERRAHPIPATSLGF
jgi:hypothetical protein